MVKDLLAVQKEREIGLVSLKVVMVQMGKEERSRMWSISSGKAKQ